MVKIVSLFLIGMVVLAMFGRLRWPKNWKIGRSGESRPLPKPRICPDCGRMNLRGGKCRACREGGNG
ncbi:MAG: hypothetical protein JKY00_09720 [Roseicyclus sp.]|nr:hypothetical protein [Roseicyclus sp.]